LCPSYSQVRGPSRSAEPAANAVGGDGGDRHVDKSMLATVIQVVDEHINGLAHPFGKAVLLCIRVFCQHGGLFRHEVDECFTYHDVHRGGARPARQGQWKRIPTSPCWWRRLARRSAGFVALVAEQNKGNGWRGREVYRMAIGNDILSSGYCVGAGSTRRWVWVQVRS